MSEIWQFVVDWYDSTAQLIRKFILKYHVESNQVEMVEIRNKKLFLKKSDCPPQISKRDFAIGSKLLIYSRELMLVDYADQTTRQKLESRSIRSVVIMSPEGYHNWGKLVDKILSQNTLCKMKLVMFTETQIETLSALLATSVRQLYNLSTSPCLVLIVQGEDVVTSLYNLSQTLNQDFSASESSPVLITPSRVNQTSELLNMLSDTPTTATLDCCTCCIIKPHAIKEGNVGKILDIIISQGYEISAMETLRFDKQQSEEFLEVYRGVVPEFADFAFQLTAGLSIALELRAQEAVHTFRQTCGPWDIAMAKELRPATIRALYGKDRALSAVHCTDLPSDAELECEYCFRIMEPVK